MEFIVACLIYMLLVIAIAFVCKPDETATKVSHITSSNPTEPGEEYGEIRYNAEPLNPEGY